MTDSVLFKNGLLVDSRSSVREDLLVVNGKIAGRGTHLESKGFKVVDATGLCILPGLIDAHTHYHLVSRGTVTADSFEQGSRLASFGGVTTVIDFSDHQKGMSLTESLQLRLNEMAPHMAIDYSIHQGVYRWDQTIPLLLAELKKRGVRALKIFTTYRNVGYMIEEREQLLALLKAAKALDMMVCAHCECNSDIEAIEASYKGDYNPPAHAVLRPSCVEAHAIEELGTLAIEADAPLYIVHLSSASGLETVRSLRSRGAKLYVETTPHYLFLDKSKLEGPQGSLYVMTPPLREKSDNLALQEAVVNGEIQVIATDHCAFTKEQKLSSSDCRTIYPGIPGTEEMLPLLHTFSAHGAKISLNSLVAMMSANPAKLFSFYPQKGSLDIGTDADLILFDPDEEWTLNKETVHSASGYTPYEGQKVSGLVRMTYVRGRMIMGEGVYLGQEGFGSFIGQC